MVGKKKNLIAGAMLIFVFGFFYSANAADVNLPEPEQIWDSAPSLIKDFTNSAKQIGGDVSKKSAGFDFGFIWSAPANLYEKADALFLKTTGLRILEALKSIGNIIVWFLEAILGIFKWLLSLVE